MRKILPGVAATAIVYPFLGISVSFSSGKIGDLYRPAIVLVAIVLSLGMVLSFLSNDIYKIYEGRSWPQSVFDAARRLQQGRVEALVRAAARAKGAQRSLKHRELWYTLRRYPVNEAGEPYASHPTLLGNILAAYEDYPLSRYGMDSVFYWTRIWLQLEREKKDEIDSIWCVADGLVSLSAV